ncbi:hypothetical protein [Neopusillimonas aromaticivorans]|uniref:hypothetical protein n=1 Tax=Neopusillimonas aromaticivorans TaxID=2979868 RepID=UPI0025976DA4|nr:hypothetical protein [Neopusillimonas aromaticivorans]WJJ94424.1 hypothetical protein N7E01_05380 [Neopusillimonas aromaticivorans]
MQSDRDVLVAREVVDILHFHHQPWIMPPPSSPPTPVPGFSGLSGLLGLQPALGEISGGRINGGASPPFVRVKAEDSSLKNIRL